MNKLTFVNTYVRNTIYTSVLFIEKIWGHVKVPRKFQQSVVINRIRVTTSAVECHSL